MSSSNYAVSFENLNMTSGEKSSSSYNVTDTVGQNANGLYGTTGYVVRAGFQYLYSIGKFQFTISNSDVAFGELTPNTFSTGSTTLSVSNGGAGGYQVTAYEDKPLTIQGGGSTTIPDTTCDAGGCSESISGTWTDATKHGFGYRMTGQDVPTDFSGANTFKQFANKLTNEVPQVVMSSLSVGKNRTATVTYKVSIPGSQAAGNYENSIVYIATPGY